MCRSQSILISEKCLTWTCRSGQDITGAEKFRVRFHFPAARRPGLALDEYQLIDEVYCRLDFGRGAWILASQIFIFCRNSGNRCDADDHVRSEEHTSELQSLMRI